MNAKPLAIRANMSDSYKVVNERKPFSLNERINILQQTGSGQKPAAVAKELGITPTTVSTILKDREKIEKLYERYALCADRKCLRFGDR